MLGLGLPLALHFRQSAHIGLEEVLRAVHERLGRAAMMALRSAASSTGSTPTQSIARP